MSWELGRWREEEGGWGEGEGVWAEEVVLK